MRYHSRVRTKGTGVHGKKKLQIVVCQTYRAKCVRTIILRMIEKKHGRAFEKIYLLKHRVIKHHTTMHSRGWLQPTFLGYFFYSF